MTLQVLNLKNIDIPKKVTKIQRQMFIKFELPNETLKGISVKSS